MEKVEINSISIEEFDNKLRQFIREVLKEVGVIKETITSSVLMNAKQAADYLGISVSTLRKKTAKKEIPHFKPGKALLFYKSELDAWIESSRKMPREKIAEDNLGRSFIRQIRGKR